MPSTATCLATGVETTGPTIQRHVSDDLTPSLQVQGHISDKLT